MRRITLWAMSTISALILLFSYQTSTGATGDIDVAGGLEPVSPEPLSTPNATTDSEDSDDDSDDDDSDSDDDSESAQPSPTPSDSADSGGTTLQGSVAQTRWGPVQVQITVSGNKITKSEVLQVPWDNHEDQRINSYAVPILNAAVVAAQSAEIDMVSGATVTSVGYIQSLQSAIDQM